MTEGRTIAISPQELAALMVAQTSDGDSIEQAVREGRCLKPSMGCGKIIPLNRQKKVYFPHPSYRDQWKITGLCAACQDRASLQEESDDTIVLGSD
jgi:hypothetical protein